MPTFNGYPQSLLMRITLPESPSALWQWGTANNRLIKDLNAIAMLTNSGYERVSEDFSCYACLASQGYECFVLEPPAVNAKDDLELWARPEDIRHVKQCPVILAFRLDSLTLARNLEKTSTIAPEETAIQMLQYLPPPQTGEIGVVINPLGDTYNYTYRLEDLPDSAKLLQNRLSSALQALAMPSDWCTYTPYMYPAANEPIYHRTIIDKRTQLLSSRDKKMAEDIKAEIAQLEEAHEQVQRVRQSELKPDWAKQWKEIQVMARNLAEAYWTLHRSQAQKNRPIPEVANVFHDGFTDVLTSLPFQAYSYAAIAPKTTWSEIPPEKEHEVGVEYRRSKQSGTAIVQVRGDATGQSRKIVLSNLFEQVKKLSDLDSDVFLALVAQMLQGQKDEHGNTWITAQKILDYRGIEPMWKTENGQKRRAGHRQEDIEVISQCISRMENTWICVFDQEIIDDEIEARKGRKRSRSRITRESRLFMFGDIMYHQELRLDGTPSRKYPIAWQYRESNWMIPFLEGPNRFAGVLLDKTLNYDPHNEFWEKRLAKYFMVYFRSGASKGYHPIKLQTLFDELNLPVNERFPQRTCDRFEKAMDTLQKDGHLTWDYAASVKLPSRNWISTWMGGSIAVDPPKSIRDQYRSIATHAQVVRSQSRMQCKPQQKKQGRKPGGKKD